MGNSASRLRPPLSNGGMGVEVINTSGSCIPLSERTGAPDGLNLWDGFISQGPGPQWRPLSFGPHAVRIGSGPTFDHDGWPDEGVGPKLMPALKSKGFAGVPERDEPGPWCVYGNRHPGIVGASKATPTRAAVKVEDKPSAFLHLTRRTL